jgi:hypothetical protein
LEDGKVLTGRDVVDEIFRGIEGCDAKVPEGPARSDAVGEGFSPLLLHLSRLQVSFGEDFRGEGLEGFKHGSPEELGGQDSRHLSSESY